jgi:hypothetical protein
VSRTGVEIGYICIFVNPGWFRSFKTLSEDFCGAPEIVIYLAAFFERNGKRFAVKFIRRREKNHKTKTQTERRVSVTGTTNN